MKKSNNKFRNNNNQIYSLNYKFDSQSIAGKFSATALDLIKKYNELAKDAMTNNDYVNAELFRQYAEHYRKIVTDINEKKALRQANEKKDCDKSQNELENHNQNDIIKEAVNENADSASQAAEAEVVRANFSSEKKGFVVVEIKEENNNSAVVNTDEIIEEKVKTRRTSKKKAI